MWPRLRAVTCLLGPRRQRAARASLPRPAQATALRTRTRLPFVATLSAFSQMARTLGTCAAYRALGQDFEMALTHIDHHAETFTSLNGDHTVKEYLDSAVAIFPGLKSLEVRCESTGPIAVAIGKTM